MPMFDFKCECGTEFESLIRAGDVPMCPECRSTLVAKTWKSRVAATVIGDEIDYVAENLGPNPIRIRSREQRRRIMREQGLEEHVRHVGVPGTDRSPYTTNWSTVTQETLDGAKHMLERNAGVKSIEEVEDELDAAVEDGEVGVAVPVGGRSINVRIGKVYSGVIDTNVIRGVTGRGK